MNRIEAMPPPESRRSEVKTADVVLLTGASGYVGGRLVRLLEGQRVVLRCLARSPEKLRPLVEESTQVVRGDVLDAPSLNEALHGVQTAYYLVHLMSGSKDFEQDDRQAATNFAEAAKQATTLPFMANSLNSLIIPTTDSCTG